MDIVNMGTAIASSGITLFLAKFLFTYQFKKIEQLDKEQREIKENYIDRFEKVLNSLAELKEHIARLDERLKNKRKS